jgi:hypothetical protein
MRISRQLYENSLPQSKHTTYVRELVFPNLGKRRASEILVSGKVVLLWEHPVIRFIKKWIIADTPRNTGKSAPLVTSIRHAKLIHPGLKVTNHYEFVDPAALYGPVQVDLPSGACDRLLAHPSCTKLHQRCTQLTPATPEVRRSKAWHP